MPDLARLPIDAVFQRAKAAHRCALIAYVVAGDPDMETTERVVAALSAAGVDLIELGIPYGDPLADGPTIAAAASRALAAGATLKTVFAMATRCTSHAGAPLLFFTYVNPIVQYGVDRFANAVADAGVCGAIVPDIPLEEIELVGRALADRGLALPLLVSPTTPQARAAAIAEASQGFVYLVSRLGVTGAGASPDFGAIRAQIATLRSATGKPLAVGFGISTAAHVRSVAAEADGVIVGSALIDAYAGYRGEEAASRAAAFIKRLMEGTARTGS